MNKNCNSFSSKFCKVRTDFEQIFFINNKIIYLNCSAFLKTICGEDIPSWVNRLAYLTTFVPFIERVIPKEWISPIAIQHTVESHMNETNNSMTNANATNTNNYSSTNLSSLQQYSSASCSNEQQNLVQTTSNINSKSESLSSQQSVQSTSSNNSIWSALFNNLEKLEPNK